MHYAVQVFSSLELMSTLRLQQRLNQTQKYMTALIMEAFFGHVEE